MKERDVYLCGGADSIDESRRIKHLSWWEDEAITQSDIDKVTTAHYDYIFTHCCPLSILNQYKNFLCELSIDEERLDHTSENRLQELMEKISFEHWWFGHYHQDINLDNRFTCLYHSFKELI